jgi:DNA (cytosine-5)-methyltransferase 1
MSYVCAELCAGAGGAAIGLEQAGFEPGVLVEIDADAVQTLRLNRPGWQVVQGDVADGHLLGEFDLLSAGLPCTPHSRAGKQAGEDDERHLWHAADRIVTEARPRAVMFETASDILGEKFAIERLATATGLRTLGYTVFWETIDALWYGVSQHRRRAILVAFREPVAATAFRWPAAMPEAPPTVGQLLYPRMAANGWPGADAWRDGAAGWSPTIVGGSTKHGGPDLGPTQSRTAWARLGVDGSGVADGVPGPDGKYQRGVGKIGDADEAGPMLTTGMGAALQGFPEDWSFHGGKTSRWRQIGNAFPPPAARAVGTSVRAALGAR